MATDLTTLQTAFTDAIGELKAPVIAVMSAGLAITTVVAGFKLLRKTFRNSAS